MKITILAENYVPTSLGLLGEHGFSALIEHKNRYYLFDTGQHGVCVHNAKALKLPFHKVEQIFLSHGHYDHCNGLESVLRTLNKKIKITAHPDIFKKTYVFWNGSNKYIGIKYNREFLEHLGAEFNFVTDFYPINEDMYLTGEVALKNNCEKIPEAFKVLKEDQYKNDLIEDDNSLVIRCQKGLVLLLGCAHRGIVNIIQHVKEKLPSEKIIAVIGGTHLEGASEEHLNYVRKFIKEEGLELFAPAHCTGLEKSALFQREFPNITKPVCCGQSFEL